MPLVDQKEKWWVVVMGVGLDPELTKWSIHLGPAIVLTKKGYKEHYWLVISHQPLWLSPTSSILHMPSDCCATSSCIIPGSINQMGIGCTAIHICGQTGHHTNQSHAITPFMYNKEEYWVSSPFFIDTCDLTSSSMLMMRMEWSTPLLITFIVDPTPMTQIKSGSMTCTIVTSFMPWAEWHIASRHITIWIPTSVLPSNMVLFGGM